MPQTVTEKIVQAHAEGLAQGHEVRAGDMVIVRPAHVLTHDNTGAVMPKFEGAIGADAVAEPSQPVFALDHKVQDRSEANLDKYARIEAFARKHGIAFHPAGAGIGHQLMMEGGFVKPGGLAVASDSHSNMYGALAAVGTPVVRTDAAAIWATGTTWWQVPRTVKVTLTGALREGVSGKDVALALCGVYNNEEVLNAAVEFHGDGVASLSMAERMTISNMTTEWGSLVGWFPHDEVCAGYMRQRHEALTAAGHGDRVTAEDLARWEASPPAPDNHAVYAAQIHLDLAQVTPMIAGPHVVQKVQPLARVLAGGGMKIHRAYLLSCVNGRLDDLVQAAAVLEGKKVADGVRLYVAAASAEVQLEAEERGAWQTLVDAGAETLPPGCGACIGLGAGLLDPGEVGISATNRNFKGRMGSRDAEAYLASPVVVAASAAAGEVAHPQQFEDAMPDHQFTDLGWEPEARQVQILDGFPSGMSGRVLHLPADNLNTDGIYGKDVTYIDDLTPEQMAGHAMANYDPRFQKIAAAGDIIVAGRNFGTGSSREQAATALKFRGVQMVIAASFSQTYLRNAFNNAFICLESPSFAAAVREALANEAAGGARTVPADEVQVDFASSRITWRGQQFAASPMGPAAQELILAGGLEALTRKKIGQG